MKTISQKDLRALRLSGAIPKPEKPKVVAEDPSVKALRLIEASLGANRQELIASLLVTQKQGDAIILAVGKEQPKKLIECTVTEHFKNGRIKKFTLKEL